MFDKNFHFTKFTTWNLQFCLYLLNGRKNYCVKSVHIRSYSGPHFPAFRMNTEIETEYGKMRTRITPNTDTFYAGNASIRRFKNHTTILSFFQTYKPGQNILQKVKKSGKIAQDQKLLISPFAIVWTTIAKKWFLEWGLEKQFTYCRLFRSTS